MRIIAGEFRGRVLLGPRQQTTRPITDRVKQSLFDILTPCLADAVVYDCFAGTGSMGLESLSRGAAHSTFFEADRSALLLLNKNLQALKVEQRATVISGDLFGWFNKASPARPRKADLIFLDPPYRFLREQPLELKKFAEIVARDHLNPEGPVGFRHDANDELELEPLKRFDRREYGGMTLEFLRV